MKIPGLILKQMYTLGSLENTPGGVRFSLKNRLSNATVTRITEVWIDGREVPLGQLTLSLNSEAISGTEVSPERAIPFPLARVVEIQAAVEPLGKGAHEIALAFETTPFGALSFKVRDSIAEEKVKRTAVPFSKEDNYSPAIVRERQAFAEEYTGVKLQHINKYSFDAAATKGNIENFAGVAQVPIGLAGPVLVDGEHAQGEFLVPLATTEGTLVASYNRGIKV
ncbi:MAG TPA: hydroxymethylglutaryl-CoA reductase, partial [Thermoanaerobaculia bacterium]|nr:hydroxymethylglutaryl-CoA reductase [Thermoanaerobaculia bacterium]